MHRHVSITQDRDTLAALLPVMRDIIAHHMRGTHFGIGMTPDGLLTQGAEGYQLTWMDAKVGNWVVTPRRSEAVEINALWYNALRVVEKFLRESGEVAGAEEMGAAAQRAAKAFNERFWNAPSGHLFDVIDGLAGNDPALRPNQLFAISLPFPVLAPERWPAVLGIVEAELLTPVGLRTLGPRHPDYKPKYHGDLRARDAAYHQGTVWPWLIGPFIDAWLKVHPDGTARAGAFLGRPARASRLSRSGLRPRDLRRRAAVCPTRLYRPSVERGGTPADHGPPHGPRRRSDFALRVGRA